ncbi:MAG TPA: SLC13 family permease [Acidimicrobiia bacterium]|nr:SLC13 family permease [Acidimicrobiia bacterium]
MGERRHSRRTPEPLLIGLGFVAAAVAVAVDRSAAADSAGRAWPPFVLVTGLLLVGLVAHDDGLFAAAAARLERLPWLRAGRRSDARLLAALLLVVAATTAVLNLDTSVAFLTPILVLAARRRGAPEEPFLYGAVFMSNSASLLLPGSNLTNLLVLAGSSVNGAAFAARMAPAWLAAITVTAAVLLFRLNRPSRRTPRAPRTPLTPRPEAADAGPGGDERLRWSLGAVATAAAAVLVLAVSAPAVPVLAVGAGAVVTRLATRRLTAGAIAEAVGPAALVGVYGIAVALGTLASRWSAPARLVARSGPAAAATVGTMAAVAVNNLPAAVLLAPHRPAHPEGLLLGLNLGPNLAVTGSLSALLWYRAARRVGAHPSARTYSWIGLILVPLSIAAALAALALTPGGGF